MKVNTFATGFLYLATEQNAPVTITVPLPPVTKGNILYTDIKL